MTEQDAVAQLDAMDDAKRREAVAYLAGTAKFPEPGPLFNLHCHSFFSYNADGWSPSRIAYECRMRGLQATALCDFDVLDGMNEFFAATAAFGIRSAVHLETRAYLKELADADINSPGEHGVTYIMGCGFLRDPAPETSAAQTLQALRIGAQSRNTALISRINAALPAIAIDEARDLFPMTPRATPTERHIIRAYRLKALEVFPDPAARAAFWAPLLKIDPAAFAELEASVPKCEEAIRTILVKRGGIGYQAPDSTTFPPVPTFVKWVKSCEAIPTTAWLDGTSGGEASADDLLDLMGSHGCQALNIIPDRNIKDKTPEKTALKQKKLAEMVKACEARDLPVIIGTEMNKLGLPFVDDITDARLAPYAETFTKGMWTLIGHTLLGRFAQAPYGGARAEAEFSDRAARNAFYAAVGRLPALTTEKADRLRDLGPGKAYAALADEAKRNG